MNQKLGNEAIWDEAAPDFWQNGVLRGLRTTIGRWGVSWAECHRPAGDLVLKLPFSPAWIEYKFTPAEINHPYHIRESCVQNCKNKVHATPRCVRFLPLHTRGTFLVGWIRVSCSLALDTSTCCTKGMGMKGEKGRREVRDVDVQS